jgi:RNA polymerase-binding transcription factor DksA
MKAQMATPRERLVEEFRDRLAAARLALARSVARTDDDLETIAAHDSRELAEDAATGTVGALLGRLDDRAHAELDEIDAAQARLEAGVFGVCEGCHRPIPLRRLRAMLTARCCDPCQIKREER